MPVTLTTAPYGGWPNCLHLTNGRMEVVVTTDVGPRVIRCGFQGEQNLFKEYPDLLGKTGGDQWRIYGGHRLWHAPEIKPRTYAPDNEPVSHEWDGTTLTVTQPVEPTTGIQKVISFSMQADADTITVTHTLINRNLWKISTAPWCLSVLAAGGRAVIPQERFIPFPDALLPARPLVLWHYTDMADERFTWGSRTIQLRQAPIAKPQKIGLRNSVGWGLYELNGTAFIKRAELKPDAEYPDFNCNWEIYTDKNMLELETLGPVTAMEPAESVTHVETWELRKVATDTPAAQLAEVLGLQ